MHKNGFTLVELLITLVIAGILFAFSFGALPDLVERQKARSVVDRFAAIVALARLSAITRNVTTILCPGQQDGCGSRNTWHQGTLVFADHNRNHQYDAEDEIIGQLPPMPEMRIQWRAFRARSYLRFTPKGVTDWQNGHFLFCPAEPNLKLARQLVLNHAGRTYRTNDSNGDGIHEDARGRPIVCNRG